MNEVLKWLIGLRQLPSGAAEGDWHFEFQSLPQGATGLAVVALFVAALAGVFWLYRLEGRQLSLGRRLTFVALRGLIIAGAAIMLLDPVLVIDRHEKVPSHLLVLVDTSESMGLTDPYMDERAAQKLSDRLQWKEADAKEALKRLRATTRYDLATQTLYPVVPSLADGRKLSTFHFDTKSEAVESWDAVSKIPPQGTQTAIGEAIKQALAAHRGQPLAGILIVTDGQSNSGEDPRKLAQQAAKQAVAINILAMGTEQGPSNVRLADLETSPAVFVRDPIKLAAVVESQGLQGQPANVKLEQRKDAGDWTEIAVTPVVLGEDGAVQRVEFDYTPEAIGQYDFRATVADVEKELSAADNTATQSVKVVRQQIRVLFIAGAPSPEVQFIRNAMMRDRMIEFSSWLQTANEKYEQVGHKPLRRLPASQQELNYYDVIVLFDPQMKPLGSQWAEMLTKFVGDAGGGLVFVAGETNSPNLFSTGGDEETSPVDLSWMRMLPVVSEAGLYQSAAEVRLSARETWNLELTSDGNDDRVFQFSPDPAKNRDVLTSLPGMYWYYPVTRAKPGATVLAQHGDPRMRNSFGRHVLMATQRYGPGRTVFIGFDSTYRWRYLHEEYFDGFWARLIDRAGRSKVLGGRYPFTISTDRAAYRVGDQVKLRVQIIPGQEESAITSQLRGDVEAFGQEPIALEFEPVANQADALEASFKVEKAGSYLARVVPGVSSIDAESGVRAATLPFKVDPPQQELDNPRLNRALLDEIAQTTGGKVFTLADVNLIPDAFRVKEVDRVLEYREEMFDAPLLALAIVAFLTTEWVGRKMLRLA
jgi:hypothetical protein